MTRYVVTRGIGDDDALLVRAHIIVGEIKNLVLAGEVYHASTTIPAEKTDPVLLDELILKVSSVIFSLIVTIKGNDHANYH